MGISSITGSVSGKWTNNPQCLPRTIVSGNCYIKTAPATEVSTGTPGVMTAIALLGATVEMTGANAYQTVCDLTGAGFFFNAISSTGDAAFTPTFKFTVDGVETVIALPDTIPAVSQLIIGPLLAGRPATADAALTSGEPLLGGYGLAGFVARDGGCQVNSAAATVNYLPTPMEILTLNLAALRYERSLKIEYKTSDLHATADAYNYASVTYQVDL